MQFDLQQAFDTILSHQTIKKILVLSKDGWGEGVEYAISLIITSKEDEFLRLC